MRSGWPPPKVHSLQPAYLRNKLVSFSETFDVQFVLDDDEGTSVTISNFIDGQGFQRDELNEDVRLTIDEFNEILSELR